MDGVLLLSILLIVPLIGPTSVGGERVPNLSAILPTEVLAEKPACHTPPVTGYVTDQVRVLSPSSADRLRHKLKAFDRPEVAQMIVFIDSHVPDELSLEEYTLCCANAWKVGYRGRDNGIVLFVFLGDRKSRLEVGFGLEDLLTPIKSKEILDKGTPLFVKGFFSDGIEAIVDEVISTMSQQSEIESPP